MDDGAVISGGDGLGEGERRVVTETEAFLVGFFVALLVFFDLEGIV